MGVRIETAVTPRPCLGRRGGLGGRRARRARAATRPGGGQPTVRRTCCHPKSEATRDVVNPKASMGRTTPERDGRRRRREGELQTAPLPCLSRRHKGTVGGCEWWERARAPRRPCGVLESQDSRSSAAPSGRYVTTLGDWCRPKTWPPDLYSCPPVDGQTCVVVLSVRAALGFPLWPQPAAITEGKERTRRV